MMTGLPYATALIVGAGSGISASLARQLAGAGLTIALAARDTGKLAGLAAERGAIAIPADATDPASIERLFATVDERLGSPYVVIYNASARLRGSLAELDPEGVRRAIDVTAFGAFLTVQQAARRMVAQGRGAILLTGATAG